MAKGNRSMKPGRRLRRESAFALLAASMLAALLAGCNVAKPYEQAERTDDMPVSPEAVPSYRLPQPPAPVAPSPPASVTTTSTPPVFLDRLEDKASEQAQFKYCLDERYKRYHRFNCPYAPKQTRGYTLAVQGTDLAHRETMQTTGTHMSRAQIKAKGYRPCQHCRPDLDQPPAWYRGESREYRQRQSLPFSVHGSGRMSSGEASTAGQGRVGGSSPMGLSQ
ncbi:MAG: hypothetical protein HPY44_19800 [Armatimonadetes bacterium]|nr:hypothetical protein [Armatimonadota bacterium]